jgi:hypothetical protein
MYCWYRYERTHSIHDQRERVGLGSQDELVLHGNGRSLCARHVVLDS